MEDMKYYEVTEVRQRVNLVHGDKWIILCAFHSVEAALKYVASIIQECGLSRDDLRVMKITEEELNIPNELFEV